MAETTIKYITLENLGLYNDLLLDKVSAEDAKSLKTVALSADGSKLLFYKVEEPVGDTAPAYEIELPKTDLSNLLEKFDNATAGDIVVVNADGKTISDSGIKLDTIATKDQVNAVDAKANANKDAIDAINNEDTGILAQAKQYADGKDAAIAAAKSAADKAQSDVDALKPRVSTVETDIATLKGTGEGSVKKQIDDAFNDFATKISDDNVVNTFKELVDYCATHSAEAAEMAGDIQANATAIAELETYIGTLPEGTSAKTVIEYINSKVDSVDFSDVIATAKQEAIDAAAADATSKANKALSDAKAYTDSKNDAMNDRVSAIETAIADGGSVDLAIKDAKKAGTDAAAIATAAQADVDALEGTVTTISGKVSTNETNIANLQTASSAQADRIAALEKEVNEAQTIEPVTEAEIRALFA